MAWLVLFVAGLFEVGWAVCLKSAQGFTRPWPTIGFGVFMFASVYLLGLSLRSLPLGTAYTVWTGIGAVGAVAFGIVVWGEPADVRRLVCIGLIITGITGLKLVTPH
ncbi:DMT family transporter [Planctomyces sp. SH-PL62]|uniref:DMT family transporter n=1 Tax=Planctomyces sp. SH-PL62 TaxID=1636152 RepID=UPI00078DA10D|nr:multidrug efflux SMR transporter [Planctomyces sp. SH-PL62]AMV37976.1 Quaternary ammonium compound-resistance protein SugE [Planctomyces sp. SH-PL62]